MSRYIDADKLNDEYNEHIGPMVKRSEYHDAVIMTNAQEMLQKSPTADVIPLDRIKEAREEVAKGWYTRPASRYEEGKKDRSLECMRILDKLIAESEGK